MPNQKENSPSDPDEENANFLINFFENVDILSSGKEFAVRQPVSFPELFLRRFAGRVPMGAEN